MKRYMLAALVAVSTSSLYLAPVKKGQKTSQKKSGVSVVDQELQNKIDAITRLVPHKPFQFDAQSYENIFEQYMHWSKKLSKKELLRIISYQEKTAKGFTDIDAQEMINQWDKKPLTQIYDLFVQYQKRFIMDASVQKRQLSDRFKQIHQEYQQEQNNVSLIRRIPVIHNLEAKLIPDLTQLTDQQLYEKIALQMQRIGFSKESIQIEIDHLKNSSALKIQQDFPHLQKELAERLTYFNGTKQGSPNYVVNTDYYLGVMHTWITTAASLVAGGASFFGLNPLMLHMIAHSTVLNPYISQKQEFSKRQVLAMLYAQYKSYDALQDLYLNPNFQEAQLTTKEQLLHDIQLNLQDLELKPDIITQQMQKYRHLKKTELEIMQEELKELHKNYLHLPMSEDEKNIAVSTKNDLLKKISTYLSKSSLSEQEKQDFLKQVQDNDTNFARTVLLDLMQHESKKFQHLSSKESFLIKSPKIVTDAVGNLIINRLHEDWNQAHKSPLYQYYKEKMLRKKLQQKEETALEYHAKDLYEKSNLIRSII